MESQYCHSLCNVGDIFILSFAAGLQGVELRGGRLNQTLNQNPKGFILPAEQTVYLLLFICK